MKNRLHVKFFVLLVWVAALGNPSAAEITLIKDPANPTIKVAADDIKKALVSAGHNVMEAPLTGLNQAASNTQVVLATWNDGEAKTALQANGGNLPASLKAEGFSLRVTTQNGKTIYWVIGRDRIGTLYGGFDIAESIIDGGLAAIVPGDHNPYLEKRGIKMNIPLDARNPAYADWGTAAQQSIKEVWDMNFWTEQLDRMARNRYNAYTLWNCHPFPSLVKVEKFPQVALADVKVADGIDFKKKYSSYSNDGGNQADAEILANLKTIKTLSIDEKIKFWQQVMQYGHDRGISFYFYTWNIFLFGAEGKHGINQNNWQSNANLKEYFRESVKAMLATYPHLAGIGITAGEGFSKGGVEEKEQWLFEAYGKAFLEYRKENPERRLEFVHRNWWSDANVINRIFKPLIDDPGITFNYSYKYAFAHLYTWSDKQLHVKNKVNEHISSLPPGGKYWWNLRNDDIFNFRFGSHGFIKEFIETLPPANAGVGFHMGSDGYVWTREFTDKDPEPTRILEMEKHWYNFKLWGRLGYNPNTPASIFEKEAKRRMPGVDVNNLMKAWNAASLIIPAVNRFHWHQWDFQWSPEYSSSQSGYHDVLEALWGNNGGDKVAAELKGYANTVFTTVPLLRGAGGRELRKTLGDLEALAHLGNYYAEKISAAQDHKAGNKSAAVNHATLAAEHWRKYASVASSQYTDQILGRGGPMSWKGIFQKVLGDINKVGGNPNLASAIPTEGGMILEAEEATLVKGSKASTGKGFTGTGFVDFGAGTGGSLTWNYEAPHDGEYLLEFRYALNSGELEGNVDINGKPAAGPLEFWTTSGNSTWGWDRKTVTLAKGKNEIRLSSTGKLPLMDHVNILQTGKAHVAGIEEDLAARFGIHSLSSQGVFFELGQDVAYSLQVYSLQGKLLFNIPNGRGAGGRQFVEFPKTQIRPGLNVLVVKSGESTWKQKFFAMD